MRASRVVRLLALLLLSPSAFCIPEGMAASRLWRAQVTPVPDPARVPESRATPTWLAWITPVQRPCLPPLLAPAVVFFASNAATTVPHGLAVLDTFGAALALPQYAGCRIIVSGHTDETGNADTNQRLSEQRATHVKHYLVEHWAVAPHRIVIRGYGASRPRGATKTPAEQAAHRRVEVTLEPPQVAVSG